MHIHRDVMILWKRDVSFHWGVGDEPQETSSEGRRIERNDDSCHVLRDWPVAIFQTRAGRRSPMKASLQDLQCFRAQRSITVWVQVPVYPGGPLTWRSILEDVFWDSTKFSRYPVRSDPGMTMDIFLPPVWVTWSMPGYIREWLYCCLYGCSVLQLIQMLEESRF